MLLPALPAPANYALPATAACRRRCCHHQACCCAAGAAIGAAARYACCQLCWAPASFHTSAAAHANPCLSSNHSTVCRCYGRHLCRPRPGSSRGSTMVVATAVVAMATMVSGTLAMRPSFAPAEVQDSLLAHNVHTSVTLAAACPSQHHHWPRPAGGLSSLVQGRCRHVACAAADGYGGGGSYGGGRGRGRGRGYG
jgi:hypothetical protein